MKFWALGILFLAQVLWANMPDAPAPKSELGVGIEMLVPNRLPNFEVSLPAYGVFFGVPVRGEDKLRLQANFNSSGDFNIYLIELDYKLVLGTPFFTGYVVGGPHYLRYTTEGERFNEIGANVGFGFHLPMGSDFLIHLGMKIYFQSRNIISFGGGFAFLL